MTPNDAVTKLRDTLTGHYRVAATVNRPAGQWIPVDRTALETVLREARCGMKWGIDTCALPLGHQGECQDSDGHHLEIPF